MHQTPSILVLTVSLAWGGAALGDPLVDCSDKQFQSGNSAKSLMSWSNRRFAKAQKAKGSGKYPERICNELIRQRGDAHCQELDNTAYREALSAALSLCESLKPEPSPEKQTAAAPVKASEAVGKALVDCSDKRFQSGSGAKSLMGWSNDTFTGVLAAQGTGIYPEYECTKVITQRGGAHCKALANTKYASALQDALTLCHDLKNPAKTKGKMLVDCKDKRFSRRKPVPVLVAWSLSRTARLDEWSTVQAKARCDDSMASAGSAHCMLPNAEGPRDAIESVKHACASDVKRRRALAKSARAADAKSIAAAKANRRIRKFPRGTFKGALGQLASQMKAAMVAGGIAKKSKEILKVAPMGQWQQGRYRGTHQAYRKVNGTVLWHDSDQDGVCRFTTYKFVQDKGSSGWGKLRFKAFCNGCAEGWAKCK